jgi:type I restriction enzyme, S subunit
VSEVLDDVIAAAQLVPLSQAVEVNPKLDRSLLNDDLDVSFVPMAAVEALSGGIDVSTVRKYGEVKKGYTHFRDGDVLFAKVTPCMENGKMAIACKLVNGVGFGSTEFHVLRPRAGVDARYIYYFVSSQTFRKEASGHMTGAVGLRRVPSAYLAEQLIALPGIEQQREIVAELEKQFSRLDEAVANLQRVKANLKRYKASVFKDAVEGRLVPTEAIASGEESDAVWVPISKAIKTLDQGWSPQCESESRSSDDEWAVMKTTAIQSMEFRAEENKHLPPGLVSRAHLGVMNGDLLITRAGPRTRVGVTCLVKSDLPRLMLCDKAYRLRAKLDIAIPAFLEVVLNSPTLLDRLDELKSGISDSGLNLTQKRFGELLVPVPSLAEQQRIVDEVDRRLSLVLGVEAEVDANLKRARALRQSVLSKSFSG